MITSINIGKFSQCHAGSELGNPENAFSGEILGDLKIRFRKIGILSFRG